MSLLLAQSLPAVFFVSPSRSPAQLVSMYDPQSVQQLESMSADVDTFFLALHPEPSRSDKLTSLAAAAIVSAYFQKVEVASMREFNRLALTSGVVPHLVSASLVLDTAESLLGFHCTGEALDAKVCKTDWIEILYTLAQLCFTDTDMSAGRDGEEGGTMQKLFDLLKSFSSVSYLSHAIGRSRYGANASNFLKECVQLRSISSTNAPSVVSHGKGRSVFAGREGEGGEGPSDMCKGRGRGAGAEVPTLSSRLAARLNIETSIAWARGSSSHIHSGSHSDSSSRCNSPRSTSSNGNINSSCAFPRPTQQEKKDRDRDPSGFSLRQVVIALAHYPCNSFELNPWSLYRMLVSSASSREGEGDGDVTNDVTSDDTMLRMARVFKIFCAQFDVSSLALTEYLSSFYKEDYYVADTAQMLSLRDEEGRHGVPESHFRFDGLSRYTKRVKVMKPAIEGVMDSQVFDLLFSERIAVLLHSHAQLLCWEFSRACSQHRSADPFTRHLHTPLPTARTLRAVPHDCRMSVSGAVQWAQRAAGITEGEAMLQLRRTALLSGGGTVVAGYYLTFSVFLMFAVHCFSAQALLAASLQAHPAEDIFESCLRELLEWSNAILVSVQESLRVDVDVLECYYRRISRTAKTHSPSNAGLGRLTASQRLILVRHSVVVFEAMPFEESYMDLPDRPLSHLWDSCRFIRYCCHYGLLERAGSLSLCVPLRAFKAHIAAEGPLTPSPASEQCVLPIESIRCSSTLVLSLLDDLTAEANRGVTDKCDLVLDLLPTMISLLNMDALEGATTHIQRDAAQAQVIWDADTSVSCSIEDILRYGGDRAMRSFMLYRDQMVRVFGFLTAASSHVLRNRIPPAQGIFKLPLCGDVCLQEGEEGAGEGGGSSGEALLSATCAYLSCCGILQAEKMAKIAQHSLHSRLRPLVSSTSHRELPTQWTRDLYRAAGVPANGSNNNKSKQRGQSETSSLHDLVTGEFHIIDYILIMTLSRINTQSQFVYSVPHVQLVSFAEFEVMLLRCAFCCWEASGALSSGEGGGTGDRHEADPHTLLEASCMGTVDRDSRDPSSVRDAAYHYCIEGMLAPQGHREDPSLWGVDFLGPFARTLFAISEVPLPRSLATIDLEVVAVAQAAASALKRAEAARLQLEEVEAAQREERARLAEQQRLARESEVHRKYVDSHMLECGAVTSLSATDEPRKAEGMRDLMERSSYLSNASAGINVLLDGSKEQLWPVYATFCSCGDSSKPGNLSGPNLFFLLCRLGILSEEVALSDVGMLLHRISAHLQAQSPLSTPSPSSSSSSTSSMSLEGWDSPSLSFEQFLVFLCAYSELLYSGASQATLSNPASLSDDTETTTLSSLSPVPNAPMLQTAGPKSAHRHAHAHGCRPSRSTKPGRHGGDSIASDTDSLSSSSRVGNSVTEGLSSPQDKEGFQKARFQGDQPKSTGLNIIICSDACEAEGAPSASRAWFALWQDRMNSSVDFKCLLEVRILPMLRGSTLLACPQEARLRDTYAVLFSLEVLLSLQSMEGTLRAVVTSCRNEPVGVDGAMALSPVTLALKKIKIVPQIVSEERIARLEEDMMSLSVYVCMSVSGKDRDKQRKSIGKKSPSLPPVTDSERHTSRSRGRNVPTLLFAQWEWTVCVVALEAVQSAIRLRHTPTEREVSIKSSTIRLGSVCLSVSVCQSSFASTPPL